MNRDEAIAYFKEIEALHSRTSTDWQVDFNAIVARLIPQHDPQPVATLDPFADRNDIAHLVGAHAAIGFLIGLVKDLGTELKALRPKPKPPTNNAAKCAMRCGDPDFQMFMQMVHGVENSNDKIRVENRVKSMLAITSKKELDSNPEALKAWEKLVAEFFTWNKRRRK